MLKSVVRMRQMMHGEKSEAYLRTALGVNQVPRGLLLQPMTVISNQFSTCSLRLLRFAICAHVVHLDVCCRSVPTSRV